MLEHEEERNRRIVADLRRRFLSKGSDINQFDERDVDRVRRDDFYLWLFLRHKHLEIDKALDMLLECLRWRESFGINDLLERNIDRRLFEIGFLYPRNEDKNGNPLVLFHTRLYKKELHDPKEVKKFLAFGLERLTKKHPGQRVSLVFDMQESGLSNMDMDIVKFVITCFQTYFPSMLEYLIVFETPWILTAAWKIVKTWLSTEGISKIKFVNKTEILQFVNVDQLLTSMGGTDDFVYTYPPQLFTDHKTHSQDTCSMKYSSFLETSPKQDVEFSSISMSIDQASKQNCKQPNDDFTVVKQNADMVYSSFEYSLTDSSQHKLMKNNDSGTSLIQRHKKQRELKPILSRRNAPIEHVGPLITVCPANELVFCGTASVTSEILQILTITNTVSSMVAYKVKTTSPENYRVRPSSGPVPPGAAVEVSIFLQPGHVSSVGKDKFLVLSTVVPEHDDHRDLNAMWKWIPKSSIMEHRMRCRFEISNAQVSYQDHAEAEGGSDSQMDPMQVLSNSFLEFDRKLDKLHKKVAQMERDIRMNNHILIALITLFSITIFAILVFLSKDFVITHFL